MCKLYLEFAGVPLGLDADITTELWYTGRPSKRRVERYYSLLDEVWWSSTYHWMKYVLQVTTYQHTSIIKDAHNTLKHNLNIKVHFEKDQILKLVVKHELDLYI